MNIDNGERENQFLEIDLIHRPQPLDEMRRRIDMRAPLSNVRENLRKEAGAHRVGAFLVPINRLSHFIWKSRPPRDPRFERVRQINISFRGQHLLKTPERAFASTMQNRDAKTDDTEQKYPSRLKVHCVLLTDAAATSQQLRITLNNFRLLACNQGCRSLLAVLSTTSSAAALRPGAAVVGAQKEKNYWFPMRKRTYTC